MQYKVVGVLTQYTVPVCVERYARAGAGHSEGKSWLVVWEIVRRRMILLKEISPLLVVVVSEHVESLFKKAMVRSEL